MPALPPLSPGPTPDERCEAGAGVLHPAALDGRRRPPRAKQLSITAKHPIDRGLVRVGLVGLPVQLWEVHSISKAQSGDRAMRTRTRAPHSSLTFPTPPPKFRLAIHNNAAPSRFQNLPGLGTVRAALRVRRRQSGRAWIEGALRPFHRAVRAAGQRPAYPAGRAAPPARRYRRLLLPWEVFRQPLAKAPIGGLQSLRPGVRPIRGVGFAAAAGLRAWGHGT